MLENQKQDIRDRFPVGSLVRHKDFPFLRGIVLGYYPGAGLLRFFVDVYYFSSIEEVKENLQQDMSARGTFSCRPWNIERF